MQNRGKTSNVKNCCGQKPEGAPDMVPIYLFLKYCNTDKLLDNKSSVGITCLIQISLLFLQINLLYGIIARFESPERCFQFTHVSNYADSKLRFLKLSACGLLFVVLFFLSAYSALQLQITILIITEDGTHLKHRRPCQQTHQKLVLLES